MSMRSKSPENQDSSNNNRISSIKNWYAQSQYAPIFEFDHSAQVGNDRKVNLTGRWSGGIDEPMTVPIRLDGAFDQLEISDDWTMDLDTFEVDTTTFTGGIIDGFGAVFSNLDYLVWAFYDESEAPANRFKGFGMTSRPKDTSTSCTAAAFGASCTFTVSAGRGYRYNVGARIIARASESPGSEYNQGIITAITATTIVVTMDADYNVSTESNSAMTNTSHQIIQISNFSPRLYNENTLYPGGGVEYQYAYIGHISTDASSDIQLTRHRHDLLPIPRVTFFNETGIGTTTSYTVCLARWIPMGSKTTVFDLACARTSGGYASAYAEIHIDNTELMRQSTGTVPGVGQFTRTGAILPPLVRNGSVFIHAFTSAGTNLTVTCDVLGYFECNY